MGVFCFTDEEQTSTLKQDSPNVGIQVGNNCTLTLCPKTTSYCHQVGDGNIIIINIENHKDSNISIYPGTCFRMIYDTLNKILQYLAWDHFRVFRLTINRQ